MIISPLHLAPRFIAPHTTVLVSLGADPLHYGHCRYFQRAAEILPHAPVVAAIAPDAYVARKHPVLQTLPQRMETVDAIRWVDYVVPQEEDTAALAILTIKPKVFVKGTDWRDRGLPEREQIALADVGAEVIYVPTHPVSSSDLLNSYAWEFFDRLTARS